MTRGHDQYLVEQQQHQSTISASNRSNLTQTNKDMEN